LASRCALTLRNRVVVLERRSVTVSRGRAATAVLFRTRPVMMKLSRGPATAGGDETDRSRTVAAARPWGSAAGWATADAGAQSANPATARHDRWARRMGRSLLLGVVTPEPPPQAAGRRRHLITTFVRWQEE